MERNKEFSMFQDKYQDTWKTFPAHKPDIWKRFPSIDNVMPIRKFSNLIMVRWLT